MRSLPIWRPCGSVLCKSFRVVAASATEAAGEREIDRESEIIREVRERERVRGIRSCRCYVKEKLRERVQ